MDWNTPKEDLPTRWLPVGARVGAISTIDLDAGTVAWFGYGTLLADATPPLDGAGHCAVLHQSGFKVPAIHLDTGEIVYAPECRYGQEDVVRGLILVCDEVTLVTPAQIRAAMQKT
jgi:hypothetical protein